MMSCTNCEFLYNNERLPRILPCGDTFCQACLEETEKFYVKKKVNSKKCFNCKKSWDTTLIKDLVVVNDLIPNSVTPEHSDSEEEIFHDNKEYKTEEVAQVEEVNVCPFHRRPFMFWCRSCLTSCCDICCKLDHEGCRVESLSDSVIPNLDEECSSDIKSMLQFHRDTDETLTKITQQLHDIHSFKSALKKLEIDLEIYRAQKRTVQADVIKHVTSMRQCMQDLKNGVNPLKVLERKSKIICKYVDQINGHPSTCPPHPSTLIAAAFQTGKMEYHDSKLSDDRFPSTLEGFGYKFRDGKLRSILTDEPFSFVVRENDNAYNQKHYNGLCEIITEEVYSLLESDCGLIRLPVPCDYDCDPHGGKGFIFASKNWNTNKKLMIFINGSGAVRAGQWSRRLIVNDSLDSGSQIPFIKRALLIGYDVIVLNTNQRVAPDAEGNLANVEVSSTPSSHAIYAWENYVQMAAAEHIAIVAHSFGGVVTTDLYRQFKIDDFEKRVFAVAFTDSVHTLDARLDNESFIAVACNWASSDEPLDTFLPSCGDGPDVLRRSAGVNVHEETSWSSFQSIFNFFHEKLQERLGVSLPEFPLEVVPEIDRASRSSRKQNPWPKNRADGGNFSKSSTPPHPLRRSNADSSHNEELRVRDKEFEHVSASIDGESSSDDEEPGTYPDEPSYSEKEDTKNKTAKSNFFATLSQQDEVCNKHEETENSQVPKRPTHGNIFEALHAQESEAANDTNNNTENTEDPHAASAHKSNVEGVGSSASSAQTSNCRHIFDALSKREASDNPEVKAPQHIFNLLEASNSGEDVD